MPLDAACFPPHLVEGPGKPGNQLFLFGRFHCLRVIMPAHPVHRVPERHPGHHGQAAEDSPRPAHAAVAGDLHELAALGSAMQVEDGRESGRLVGRDSEVLPVNKQERPRDFGVLVPTLVEVDGKIGPPGPVRGDQVQSALGKHERAIRESYLHAQLFSSLIPGVVGMSGGPCTGQAVPHSPGHYVLPLATAR
jgi:hypothetical protein